MTDIATTSVPLPVYLAIDGEVQGPFTTAELSHLWRAGEIDPAALYWFRGMSAWSPAAEFSVPSDGLRIATATVRLTTAHTIAGRTIERELDVISAEYVFMGNGWTDLLVDLRDALGGRSATMQTALRNARRRCLDELRVEAASIGADAVIGVSLAYSTIAAGGASIMLVASGTAVALGPPPVVASPA